MATVMKSDWRIREEQDGWRTVLQDLNAKIGQNTLDGLPPDYVNWYRGFLAALNVARDAVVAAMKQEEPQP